MTFAARAERTADRLVRHFGNESTLTVRRSGEALTDPATGGVVSALAVRGTASVGAALITLDANSVFGTIGQGWKFNVAGDGTDYVVQADNTAAANIFTDVSILPVLAAEAADDAVVTITQRYGEWSYPAVRMAFRRDQVDGEHILADDYMLVVSSLGATFEDLQIADSDVVTFAGGDRLNVISAAKLQPGSDLAGWRLHVRE